MDAEDSNIKLVFKFSVNGKEYGFFHLTNKGKSNYSAIVDIETMYEEYSCDRDVQNEKDMLFKFIESRYKMN